MSPITSEVISSGPSLPSSPTAEMQTTSAIMPLQTMRGHTETVKDVVHLPDGRRIITCSWDGSLRHWDLESGTQIGDDWRDEEKNTAVLTIALSTNGKKVASGSYDGIVRFFFFFASEWSPLGSLTLCRT